MRVSIITVCFNSSKSISKTLYSVKHQSHIDIEHIIVDGASNDDTVSIIKNFGHNGPLISEKDNGIYDAMNKGILMATGGIIGILNSDDFYANGNVIEKVVDVFSSTGCDAVYGDLLYIDSIVNTKVLRKWISGGYNNQQFYRGWMPPHPTFFVRREVYEKYGVFNTKLKSSADYEIMLRFLFIEKIYAKYIPQVLVHMQDGGQSNQSIKNRLAAHKEDYMAWIDNGLTPKWYTLILKPMRKLHQFVIFKRKIFNRGGESKGTSGKLYQPSFQLKNSL